MRWLYTLPLRIKSLFRRSEVEAELDEELRYHLAKQTEANVAAGMPEPDARTAARRELGAIELRKEECRDALGWRILDVLRRDGKQALRGLLRNPGFAATAILILSLAIGANTAIFSVFDALVLHPLPYREPEQLVQITENIAKFDVVGMQLAALELEDVRRMTKSFSHIAGIRSGEFSLTGDGAAEAVPGLRVSASIFSMLEVRPVLGIPFSAAAEENGQHRVVVISENLWRRRFGADPNIVGASIDINREPYRVAAVTRRFFGYRGTAWDLWVPLSFGPQDRTPFSRGAKSVDVLARIKPGTTMEAAQRDLASIAPALAAQQPGPKDLGFSLHATGLASTVAGDFRQSLLFLLAAVGVLMLIACANVSNLLMARASTRRKEMSIRAALGAGRRHVLGQLMTESLVIAAVAGAAGVALASALLTLFERYGPADLVPVSGVGLNAWVVSFAIGVSSLASVLFGLMPSLAASADLNNVLKESTRGATAGGRRFRESMVALEVAASLVLLICAGLLIRSFLRVQRTDPGFTARNVLTLELLLPVSSYSEPARRIAFYEALQSRLQSLPGVLAAGAADRIPFGGIQGGTSFQVVGRPVDPNTPQPLVQVSRILPGYFEALGMPLLRGRRFTSADRAGSEPVLIIDEATARRFFPSGEDPLGKQVALGLGTIVGIAGSVEKADLSSTPEMSIYVPAAQNAGTRMTFTIKTATGPLALLPAIRQELAQLDPLLPLSRVATMEQRLAESLALRRLSMQLMMFFGLAALLLAATGLYGVLSYLVQQRRREVGVRVALGARPGQVIHLIARQGLLPVALGIAAGLGSAFAAARLLASGLYQMSPNDPLVYASATVLLALTAVAAIAIPARRAAAVDPVIALREE